MKVSLITVCFRSAGVIRSAIESVLAQKGVDVDYIVVDGGSNDGTVEILKEYESKFAGRMRWISESDEGMYDALNKGIKMAEGDVVGILNADDILEDENTLAFIASSFEPKVDCVYGDILCAARVKKRRDTTVPNAGGLGCTIGALCRRTRRSMSAGRSLTASALISSVTT